MESLSADYLNRVLEQMLRYGERVQFSLTAGGTQPHYQVINASEKKMTFDGAHLLIHDVDAFAGKPTSLIYALDKIEAFIAGAGKKAASTGTSSGGAPRTSASQKQAAVEAEKYEYFKTHRATLPPEIGKHAAEITTLMLNGLSAEDAFAEVVKRHF